MLKKVIIYTVVTLIAIIGLSYLIPVPRAAIEVAAEPIGLGPVLTNALLTSIILSIVIIVFSFFVSRNLKEKPGGAQNVVEFLIEGLDGMVNSIAPKKWASTFFPIVATIFIWLFVSNYFSLFTPLLGSFGLVYATEHGGMAPEDVTLLTGDREHLPSLHGAHEAEVEGDEAAHRGEEQLIIVPLFRAPTSDLNLTFALALTTMVLVQVFGLWERGSGYVGHFIRLDAFSKKGFGMGLIDFFMGLIEMISEIAKILSFSFRLFGNIFAGEVILIVISALVSIGVILVFFGLEMFVGLIQAFVFFILSLVFFSMATRHHEEEH